MSAAANTERTRNAGPSSPSEEPFDASATRRERRAPAALAVVFLALGGLPFPARAQAGPSETLDMLGLELPAQGEWKPVWVADSKQARWVNDAYMHPVVVTIERRKLESSADIQAAAPSMWQIGRSTSKVAPEVKTDKGWYAVARDDTAKPPVVDLLYVRKLGGATLVCSATLTQESLGETLTQAGAIELCESFHLKGR